MASGSEGTISFLSNMNSATSSQLIEEPLTRSLAQAKFTSLPRGLVRITNHDDHSFNVSLDQLDAMGRAFEQAVSDMPSLVKAYRMRESCLDDLAAFDLGSYDNFHTLRLVVRKLNKRIYISCGVYEDSQSPGLYKYDAKRNIRLEYFHDDLAGLAKSMRQ